MTNYVNELTEIIKLSANLIEEVQTLKKEYELLKTEKENATPILLNAEGVKKITGWSLKTAQKALLDPRMKTIWVGKGPQVEISELKKYLALNIDRATDAYWKSN